MSRYGTTRKEFDHAIAKLVNAGFKAWGTSIGHHYLWVQAPCFQAGCGRISVPGVDDFIASNS